MVLNGLIGGLAYLEASKAEINHLGDHGVCCFLFFLLSVRANLLQKTVGQYVGRGSWRTRGWQKFVCLLDVVEVQAQVEVDD
jgi:hypothetical protein